MQGAEISRSTILIAELSCKIESAFKHHFPSAFDSISLHQTASSSSAAVLYAAGDSVAISDHHLDTIADMNVESGEDEHESEEKGITTTGNGSCDDSLLNLSNAIKNRVSVEKSLQENSFYSSTTNGGENSKAAPSLVDRINQVDKLVGYFVAAQRDSK